MKRLLKKVQKVFVHGDGQAMPFNGMEQFKKSFFICTKGGGTSNCKNHLATSQHASFLSDQRAKVLRSQPAIYNAIMDVSCDALITNWITETNQPLSAVNSPAFLAMIRSMNSNYAKFTAQHLRRNILERAGEGKI